MKKVSDERTFPAPGVREDRESLERGSRWARWMELRLADRWWMGALVAATGIVLLTLNVRALGAGGEWTISILSTGSAAFVTALGFALTVQPDEDDGRPP